MVLAGIAVGVAGSVSSQAINVGKMNRDAWGADSKIKQGQRFHQHGLLVTQAHMFREDVRDLIRTANNQQHNFIVVGTLILGYAFKLLTSKVPIRAPDFMDKLYYLCSSVAFLYLMLAVLCALCSIQLSMKCERDMLTGTVRLPIEDMIGEVEETGWQRTMEGFEHQNLATILRLPGLGRLAGRRPRADVAAPNMAGPRSMGLDLDAPEGPSPARSAAPSSAGAPAGPGFSYVSLEYLRERCKKYRREFSAKEAEWTDISRCSPFFILWGMEHVLYAIAYCHVSEIYSDGQTDGYIRQGFFISVALLLSLLYNTYTNRALARLSHAWIIVDITAIFLAACLCVFANIYRGSLVITGIAVEALYLCHLVKHVCQAAKLQVAFTKRGRLDALEGESGDMEQSLSQGGRGAFVPAASEACSVEASSLGGTAAKKSSATGQLRRAIRTGIVTSAVIVCLSWVSAGIHDFYGGPRAWRGCEVDPLDPHSLKGCYMGPPASPARRLELTGTDEEEREQEQEDEEQEEDAGEAAPSADDELVLVALNVAGERRLFRHMGSTLAGEVVKLHPRESQQLRGSSFVVDRQGVELGETVPLRAAARDKDVLVEGVLDLFVNGGA